MCFPVEIIFILKVIKSHFKGHMINRILHVSQYCIIEQIIFPSLLKLLRAFKIILNKPALRGVSSVAPFILGQEEIQSNTFYYFLFFGVFIASKGFTVQNL